MPETVGGYLSFALRAVLVYRAQDAYSTHGDISSPPAVLTERAKSLVQSRETLPDFAETAGPLTTSRQMEFKQRKSTTDTLAVCHCQQMNAETLVEMLTRMRFCRSSERVNPFDVMRMPKCSCNLAAHDSSGQRVSS